MDVIYVIDILGTFAFAISGALVASKKEFDLFGVIILAFVTAVGGGMLRDILIDAHPINWIGDLNYIKTIAVAVVFTFLFKKKIEPLRKTFFLFDTIGISVFTLLGLQKGLSYDLPAVVAIIMGMVSAVFGGVIRDVLSREVPLIFKKEIYASACLLGGLVYLLLLKLNVDDNLNFICSAIIIILVRTLSVIYKLELPKIRDDVFTS
ncbi:trimeric intracellular cation channel family protein [Tenacibaculum agarivorans]|uniref:trimeric intracellular cation channel family protein n=1 Tax=Tenacibaculum agarivorans TaxID=1908389 RepID=UPI00094B9643|nr:trimeric intracellular cation channel family protein [Tenacibaculum agarivorans]